MEQVIYTVGDKASLVLEDKIYMGEVTVIEEYTENSENFYKVKLDFKITKEIEEEILKFFGKININNEYYVCDFELKPLK